MIERIKAGFQRAALVGSVAAMLALIAPATSWAQSDGVSKPKDTSSKDGKSKPDAPEALDEIIFRNGNKVQGKILSETDAAVKMRVVFAGISSETEYPKADILEIKRGVVKAAPKKDAEDSGKGEKNAESPSKPAGRTPDEEAGKIVDIKGNAIPEGVEKVYVVDLKGEFGRNVTKSPITKIMKDIERVQPDVVVFRFDFAFSFRGEETVEFDQRGGEEAFGQLELARELDTLIIDRFNSTASFPKRPRSVAWVKKALGGVAFLPCVFPEIYFTSDGVHGGIGGLEVKFEGRGDESVREKQRSLLLGRAKGLAAKGGHDERIIQAMSRGDYWLSYKIDVDTGKIVFREEKPDSPEWILLKDDGKDENADIMQDIVRMKGNDYLTLDAETAKKIGWSRGTADSLEDLLFAMKIERNFAQVKNPSSRVLKDWATDVQKAEDDIIRLLDKYGRVRVREPGGPRERNQARGQQIAILEDIGSLLDRFKEAINPRRIRAWPEGLESDVRVTIERLRNEIRNDRP